MSRDYKVCWSGDGDKLAEEVTALLADGWELAGGVSITETYQPGYESGRGDWISSETTYGFAQALTRTKKAAIEAIKRNRRPA